MASQEHPEQSSPSQGQKPEERERGIQSAGQYRSYMAMIVNAMRVLVLIPLDEMIEMAEHSDAFGPIFHPSEWMQGHEKLSEDIQLMRAAKPLWDMANMLRRRHEQSQSQQAQAGEQTEGESADAAG